MHFSNPKILWSLALVIIPLLIHFLNLRKHATVYFSNVQLLKNIQRNTKKQSKLKQLIILCCRIMAIVLITFAFAQPMKSKNSQNSSSQENLVSIYIDNSFSMNSESVDGKAIEDAKNKAIEIVNQSEPTTRFAILTNDFQNRHFRFYNQSEIIDLIAEVNVSPETPQISQIQQRLKAYMSLGKDDCQKTNYLISDFQKYAFDADNFEPDTSSVYQLIPLSIQRPNNLYIDSCWFENPSHFAKRDETLKVRIRNGANESYKNIAINLFINDSLKTLSTFDIEAEGSKTIELSYTNSTRGIQNGRVEISDYPIVYDNTFYFSYNIQNSLNILCIEGHQANRASNKISALFINDPFINYTTVQQSRVDISALPNQDAIFVVELADISSGLAQQIRSYINDGGVVTIVPPSNGISEQMSDFLNATDTDQLIGRDSAHISFESLDKNETFFKNVFKQEQRKIDLPFIEARYRTIQKNEAIIKFQDGTPALSYHDQGDGKVYLFTFPFSPKENNFIDHILFVPTLYKIALSAGSTSDISQTLSINKDFTVDLMEALNHQEIELVNERSKVRFSPELKSQKNKTIKISAQDVHDAGLYQVISNGRTYGSIAVNYHLKESEMEYISGDDLRLKFEENGIRNTFVSESTQGYIATMEDIENRNSAWWYLLLAGMMFLIIELLVFRNWK